MKQSQKNLILKYKDPKQKAKGERTGKGEHLAPAPALFIYYNETRPTRKTQGAKNKPIQARNGVTWTNTPNTHKKPHKMQITSPQGQKQSKLKGIKKRMKKQKGTKASKRARA